ncbi:hypothetical protein B0T20DRAFT_114753 [Sordaria brevicollis]|uniref:Uncharacterized protein n=1 Tax=Sordaria brevicollis TaxID=83679 RepID=A0AAE0PK73_SORBR|nr:hypothetical protein B0T20DRAFT_114753 [Sordaria brevicollis]
MENIQHQTVSTHEAARHLDSSLKLENLGVLSYHILTVHHAGYHHHDHGSQLANRHCPMTLDPVHRITKIDSIYGSSSLIKTITFDNDFRYVLHIPLAAYGDFWTHATAMALESHVHTLTVIGTTTSITVPAVYSYDTTKKNILGVPYIAMSIIPGTPLSEIIERYRNGNSNRCTVYLQTVAAWANQLQQIKFSHIGSLLSERADSRRVPDDKTQRESYAFTKIGPVLRPTNNGVTASGPFLYIEDYYDAHIWKRAKNKHDILADISAEKITRELFRHVPTWTSSGHKGDLVSTPSVEDTNKQFCLSHPDPSNLKHFLVDEKTGKVTGWISWQYANTEPIWLAQARYPKNMSYLCHSKFERPVSLFAWSSFGRTPDPPKSFRSVGDKNRERNMNHERYRFYHWLWNMAASPQGRQELCQKILGYILSSPPEPLIRVTTNKETTETTTVKTILDGVTNDNLDPTIAQAVSERLRKLMTPLPPAPPPLVPPKSVMFKQHLKGSSPLRTVTFCEETSTKTDRHPEKGPKGGALEKEPKIKDSLGEESGKNGTPGTGSGPEWHVMQERPEEEDEEEL